MDKDLIAEELSLELNVQLSMLNPVANPITKDAAIFIVSALEALGYLIVRKQEALSTDDQYALSEVIASNVSRNDEEDIDPQDINAAQIVQILLSAGWTIISPRS